MQIYQHIIDKLTESQRIRLLTDFNSLSDPSLNCLGVPCVTVESLESLMNGDLPTAGALARSWDTELLRSVTASVCSEASHVSCICAPGAKAAVGGVGDSLSEDPVVSGNMAGAILRGVAQAGLNACMQGYGTRRRGDRSGLTWATRPGVPLDDRVLEEHLNAPFQAALANGSCLGLIAEAGMEVPDAWRNMPEMYILRRSANDEETVQAIARGEILMDGSRVALQSALHNFRRLRKDLERGKATTEESDSAIAAGEAISEDSLWDALDRLLSFAHACVKRHPTPEETPDMAQLYDRAVDGMTVLLDNSAGILPLKKKTKFCIIGAPAASCQNSEALQGLYLSRKCTCLGYAEGYDPKTERSDSLISPAIHLAEGADVILLFLSAHGSGAKGRGLPANRVGLFDKLNRLGKKLVVILDAADTPDVRWLTYATTPPAAVLMAPLHLRRDQDIIGAVCAIETMFGSRSPAGRLTTTLADPTVPADVRLDFKDGPFLGYRYYDTVGFGARYPFGHGLTYTRFSYEHLSVGESSVTFTVVNKGKRPGVALPQVYIGMEHSNVLRPRRELVSYARVELAPGEKKQVTLPIHPRSVLVEKSQQYEAGNHTIYIGESVSDIRLTHHVHFSGNTLPADGAPLAEYLPSVNNLFTEHYTLEAEYTPMKASMRNPLFGIAALILAAFIEIFGMVVAAESIYPDIIAAVLALGAIVFLILEVSDRKRQFSLEQKRLEEINSILYSDARKISAPSADELFAETPDVFAVGSEAEDAAQAASSAGEHDYLTDVDPTLTFSLAATELRKLAAEKGVDLNMATVKSILSAMASTRLIVVRDMSNERFHALLSALCEYFACPVCEDQVDEGYVSESAALLGTSVSSPQRGLFHAMMTAQDHVRNIQIAALTNVSFENISKYFVPFAAYARAPYSACHLAVHDSGGRSVSYRLPPNMWFMLNLKKGESLGHIPGYIADVATVHDWRVGATHPAARCTEFHPFYYGQMLYLTEHVKADFVPDEDMWKRIDRLEEFVCRHTDFRIGNKLWLCMETYLAVLADVKTELPAALDEALAVKLLPAVIHMLDGKIARDAQGLGETLDVCLGEDAAVVCRRTVKESGADII